MIFQTDCPVFKRPSLTGRIMVWPCPSVRPSVCKPFLVRPVTFKSRITISWYQVNLGVRVSRELKIGQCDLLLIFYWHLKKNLVNNFWIFRSRIIMSWYQVHLGVRVCYKLKIGYCDLLLKFYWYLRKILSGLHI